LPDYLQNEITIKKDYQGDYHLKVNSVDNDKESNKDKKNLLYDKDSNRLKILDDNLSKSKGK